MYGEGRCTRRIDQVGNGIVGFSTRESSVARVCVYAREGQARRGKRSRETEREHDRGAEGNRAESGREEQERKEGRGEK